MVTCCLSLPGVTVVVASVVVFVTIPVVVDTVVVRVAAMANESSVKLHVLHSDVH